MHEKRSVASDEGTISSSEAVIALGFALRMVIGSLGYHVPLIGKRGYHRHFQYCGARPLSRPIIDIERGYVLSPMKQGLRLITGVEFAAASSPGNSIQLDRAERAAREIFKIGPRLDAAPWIGIRPCLPDMLPVMGPAPRHQNLWFCFGHAHHGLTLGPVSGRIMPEMMTGAVPTDSYRAFGIARFLK